MNILSEPPIVSSTEAHSLFEPASSATQEFEEIRDERREIICGLIVRLTEEALNNESHPIRRKSKLTKSEVLSRLDKFKENLVIIFFNKDEDFTSAMLAYSPFSTPHGAGVFIPSDEHGLGQYQGKPLVFINLDPKTAALAQRIDRKRTPTTDFELEKIYEKIQPLSGKQLTKQRATILLHEVQHIVQSIFDVTDQGKEVQVEEVRREMREKATIGICVSLTLFFINEIAKQQINQDMVLNIGTSLITGLTMFFSLQQIKNIQTFSGSKFGKYFFSFEETDANRTSKRVE